MAIDPSQKLSFILGRLLNYEIDTNNAILYNDLPLLEGMTIAQIITDASANALAVGPNGATNPSFNVDASTTSAATGLNIKSAAAGAGLAVSVISSGSNEALTIDGKGTGTVGINTVSTTSGLVTIGNSTSLGGAAINGNTAITGTGTITSTNAAALAVGRQGATNPVLQVNANTASVVTGIAIVGAASGGGVNVNVISSASAEAMILQAKNTTNSLTLNDTLAAATSPLLVGIATDTIAGSVTDAYTGGVRLTPTITAGSAQTVTRYNYFDINQPLGSNVTITNGALFRFNAAAGTHTAVDAGTTKTTPGTVTQWIKVNVNGTIGYIPSYSSKTS